MQASKPKNPYDHHNRHNQKNSSRMPLFTEQPGFILRFGRHSRQKRTLVHLGASGAPHGPPSSNPVKRAVEHRGVLKMGEKF
jgi:hypothetical protein